MVQAEFDEYDHLYATSIQSRLKSIIGGTPEAFASARAEIMKKSLPDTKLGPFRLLDFGCGHADFLLTLVGDQDFELYGCDISENMLKTARSSISGEATLGNCQEFFDRYRNYFDVIVLSSVLHHVPLGDRSGLLTRISNMLGEGGVVFIFEHNPWNPLTVANVKNTPIDKNAVLLGFDEAKRLLSDAGLSPSGRFIFLLPPRWPLRQALDLLFGRLRLGAQYIAVGRKVGRQSY